MSTESFITTSSGITVKKGDKITCIFEPPAILNMLVGVKNAVKLGETYIVRDVLSFSDGRQGVYLEEIVNPVDEVKGVEQAMGTAMFSDINGNLLEPDTAKRMQELIKRLHN